MSENSVPAVDIAPFLSGNTARKSAVARAVDEACRRVGLLMERIVAATVAGSGSDLTAVLRARYRRRDHADFPVVRQVGLPSC